MLKIFISMLAFGILIFGIVFLTPASYDVLPFKERKSTQYWYLDSGSTIGYTKIEADITHKKPSILYLHGGPGGRVKDEVIEALEPLSKQGHDLYFYDQVGSGHSSRLAHIKQYTVTRHREDLREIIKLVGAEEKVILIGHSWGACLAINFLHEYPESIEKLILTGPGPILPINKAMASLNPPDSLNLIEPEFSNKEGNSKAYNWRNKLILKWAHVFNSKLVSDNEVDDFFTYLNQELSKATVCRLEKQKQYEGGSGYYSHIMTLKSITSVEDKREKLKELLTPILILRGQCDNQKWGYTIEYLDLFVNRKLEIIEGVGHNIVDKKNSEYLELISQFLEE